MTTTPADTAAPNATAGVVPRCPDHGNPLRDNQGQLLDARDGQGYCHRQQTPHVVTQPAWGPVPTHGRGFEPGEARDRATGFPPRYGPKRRLRFRPDQERYVERMMATTDMDRTAAHRDLLRRAIREVDAGVALPSDGGRAIVSGQPLRQLRFHPGDDQRAVDLAGDGGDLTATHRQLLDLGIAARKRTRR